jgi:hypothetical protein
VDTQGTKATEREQGNTTQIAAEAGRGPHGVWATDEEIRGRIRHGDTLFIPVTAVVVGSGQVMVQLPHVDGVPDRMIALHGEWYDGVVDTAQVFAHLRGQVERVRAVIDSPRTMGARNASFPDGEIELLVFVKDVRAALDGPAPDTVPPAGIGGAPTTNGSILFFDLVQTEAHLINGAWLWADGGAVSERELREEDWTLVRDAGDPGFGPNPTRPSLPGA